MEKMGKISVFKLYEATPENAKEKLMVEIKEHLGMKFGQMCIITYNEKQGFLAKLTREGIIPEQDPSRENPLIILAKVISGVYGVYPLDQYTDEPKEKPKYTQQERDMHDRVSREIVMEDLKKIFQHMKEHNMAPIGMSKKEIDWETVYFHYYSEQAERNARMESMKEAITRYLKENKQV